MMKNLSVLFFCLIVFNLIPQSDKKSFDDFNLAKKYYINEDYNNALNNFLKVYKSGFDNFELNYNLGCAYYKLDELGFARFYFEKALYYKPFDKNLFYNLFTVYKKLLKDESVGEQIIMSKRILYFFPISIVIILIIFFSLLSIVFFILTLLSRVYKKTFLILSCVSIIFLICFFILYFFQYRDYNTKFFIVSQKEAKIYLAPNVMDSVITSLELGARGKIFDEINGYAHVSIGDNISGWIKKENIIY